MNIPYSTSNEKGDKDVRDQRHSEEGCVPSFDLGGEGAVGVRGGGEHDALTESAC